METETYFVARYAETDQMGIIHHSAYPIWFEAGRTDFLKNTGLKYSQLENIGLLLPLLNMECSFKSPARYEDEIVVRTKIRSMTGVRLEFEYIVIPKADGRILAIGTTSHAWTDKLLKPLNIKKKNPELWGKLSEAVI